MNFFTYYINFSVLFTIALTTCAPQVKNASKFNYLAESVIFESSLNECGCQNNTQVCVRKCCDVNYILKNDMCTFNDALDIKVPFYKNNSVDFRFIPGMVNCLADTNMYMKLHFKTPKEVFYVQNDGRLWIPEVNKSYDQYCIDYFGDDGMSGLVCFDGTFSSTAQLTCIGFMISMPFLFITFVVYALLPERNLHGTLLMCYVSALFGTYLSFLLMVYKRHWFESVSKCRFITTFGCYLFVVSFCWMNTMAFDIWSTFRGVNRFRKQMQWKRLLYYTIYALGIPLVLVALIFIVSNTAPYDAWYNPNVAGENCVMKDEFPELLFMYGPMAISIIANIVLFSITAWKIRKAQKDTAMLHESGSKKHGAEDDAKSSFKLYTKLMIGMGINWAMEIITWAVNWHVENIPPAVWYLTEFCNAAFGVFIFFIFVFNKNIWAALKKRYYMMTGKK